MNNIAKIIVFIGILAGIYNGFFKWAGRKQKAKRMCEVLASRVEGAKY